MEEVWKGADGVDGAVDRGDIVAPLGDAEVAAFGGARMELEETYGLFSWAVFAGVQMELKETHGTFSWQ